MFPFAGVLGLQGHPEQDHIPLDQRGLRPILTAEVQDVPANSFLQE